jgi:hypothetical protein
MAIAGYFFVDRESESAAEEEYDYIRLYLVK